MNNDLKTTASIFFTLFIGLILTIISLPTWAIWYRPAWIALIIIFWAGRISPGTSLGLAWITGLMIDALYGNLLGLHAFALTLVAYLTIRIQSKFILFPLLQQSLTVLLLIFLYQLIICIIQGIAGKLNHEAILFWLPAFTSTLMWPWVVLLCKEVKPAHVNRSLQS